MLSKECEVRGTDATGIAYNFGSSIKVFKRPLAAHKLKFHVPNEVLSSWDTPALRLKANRQTTTTTTLSQPALSPWHTMVCSGMIKSFARAKICRTPHIQTDSYVAVQLLEQAKTLNFTTISAMAEKIQGSFVFTILDRDDNLYFVRGDNPLAIFDFGGFYLYASTEEILRRAMLDLGYDPCEIEELLYNPALLHEAAAELLYAYC